MTTTTTCRILTVSIGPDVPVANRCLPPGTDAWSCQVWNSGRKVISRILGTPHGELIRTEQQTAARAITALYERCQDPALLLIALHVTAHERTDQEHGEAMADAVSELATMTEEGALTGIDIRFPTPQQLPTVAEIITHLRTCVSGLPTA